MKSAHSSGCAGEEMKMSPPYPRPRQAPRQGARRGAVAVDDRPDTMVASKPSVRWIRRLLPAGRS